MACFSDSGLGSNSTIINQINVSFENLSYNVKVSFLDRRDKNVLKNLNGEFRARELSAVMGPSGGGKSSLLNILSAYNHDRYKGIVKVNGNPRDLKQFRLVSSYVMQDSLLQPYLTVNEAMNFAANLKIGKQVDRDDKEKKIDEILEMLGMIETKETFSLKLSGGQQKRLSIALELVDDPRILFLDEPCSGLDASSSTQCIQLLKQLAQNGRTVICTVHQPSPLVFKQFDLIYGIAEGQCIYSGSTENIVPFLGELGLKCPETSSPADYFLEIATHTYSFQNDYLRKKIQDGRNLAYRKMTQLGAESSETHYQVNAPLLRQQHDVNPISMCVKKAKFSSKLSMFDPKSYCNDADLYSTSFLRQFYYLLVRSFLLILRNPSVCLMRVLIHFSVAIFIGILYQGVGNSAKNQMNNFKYIFYTAMFLMFTAFSSLQTSFPLELPVIKREHFNRWYSVRAYFISFIIADIPIQVFCTTIFILVTYFMTSQPYEMFRFAGFFLVNLLLCFVAQGLGLLVGSIFNVKYGVFFGNLFICPFVVFSGFFVQMKHAPELLHWLFQISFMKYALEGCVYSIFGFNREKLECDDTSQLNYCRYSYPNQLIRDIGMQSDLLDCAKNSTINIICDQNVHASQTLIFYKVIFVLILFTIFFRTVSYYIMRHRLKS